MSKKSIKEYLKQVYWRYRKASKRVKQMILNEFCANTDYNRKYVIRLLNGPAPSDKVEMKQHTRGSVYGAKVISVLAAIWTAAGYPCSERLKALLPHWLPWVKDRFRIGSSEELQIQAISARQIDRRLKALKSRIGHRIYGRTKPGTLLKHQIPIRTDNWDVKHPGWTEIDTVSHSGNSAEGLFAYTVNQTDILTQWVESRAVLGKGEHGVVKALDEMKEALPFVLQGLDSDNGSEFINWHLVRYCKEHNIQIARGRPYKKNDNAHIEQKNWTHVRKLLGWDRLDTVEAVTALNDLYRNELRLFENLFLPSMKLFKKERIGSRVKRRYDKPKTPFERVLESGQGDPIKIAELKKLKATINPFDLAQTIERKLQHLGKLANTRQSPRTISEAQQKQVDANPLTKSEITILQSLSQIFPALASNTNQPHTLRSISTAGNSLSQRSKEEKRPLINRKGVPYTQSL